VWRSENGSNYKLLCAHLVSRAFIFKRDGGENDILASTRRWQIKHSGPTFWKLLSLRASLFAVKQRDYPAFCGADKD